MHLHSMVFITYLINVRIDYTSDSSSSSCRRKGNTLRKHIHVNPISCRKGLKPCANDLTFGLTFHLTFAMRSLLMLAKCANEPNISPNI